MMRKLILSVLLLVFSMSSALAENSAADYAASAISSGMFSERDFDTSYDADKSTFIQLNGTSAICDSDAVQIAGSTVTILDEGTYILSGSLDNGMIIVNSEKTDKTQLVLDGVSIHSESSAPIYILQSDKVFITLAPGSANTLSNGGTFLSIDENSIDSVIFSKEDLTLNGSGTLCIASPIGHGIVSKDSLTITGGTYEINCASHGLAGKDDVCIASSDMTIASGKDGIHAENADDTSAGFIYIHSGTFQITAQGDGISASAQVQIEDGDFNITSGAGNSSESGHAKDSQQNPAGMNTPPDDKGVGGMDEPPMAPSDPPEHDFTQDQAAQAPDFPEKHRGQAMEQSGRISNFMHAGTERSDDAANESDSTSAKGIKATTNLLINGGTFIINSEDDSLHANASMTVNGGDFEIASGDDAFHADDSLLINAGTIHITQSYEGLEGLHVSVAGGDIAIVSSDDGLNAAGGTDSSGMGGRDGRFGHGMSSSNGSISISGGKLLIHAYGDGIDANGTLTVSGGYAIVSGPNRGDAATLDYDRSAEITGGTFIGTGASGMAQTFTSSKQGVISVNVGNQQAGTSIHVTDSDGNTVIAYSSDFDFSVVILSTPEIVKGETYTLTVGSSTASFTAS